MVNLRVLIHCRGGRALVFAYLGFLVLIRAAAAQTIDNGPGFRPLLQANQSQALDAPRPDPVEHLFGAWDGLRPYLGAQGIDLLASYTTMPVGNITGGRHQGATYAHRFLLEGDLDWQRLAGIDGFSTHVLFTERAGRNQASDFLGDTYYSTQAVSGSSGSVLLRLAYLYGEQRIYHGVVDAAAGRLAISVDFFNSPLSCNFMGNTLCGSPRGMVANRAASTVPRSSWAGRIRVHPTRTTYLTTGIYDTSANGGGTAGFDWTSRHSTGQTFPVEAGYEPVFGHDALTGHYKIGLYHDDSTYKDLFEDVAGNPAVVTRKPALRHAGETTTYVLVDQMLTRNGAGAYDGLNMLAGYSHSSADTVLINDFAFGGLVDQGLFSARPKDISGLLFGYYGISPRHNETEALKNEYGRAHHHQEALQREEMVVEFDHNFEVLPGLTIMPDFQYVIHPNAAAATADATVFGAKLKVDL